MVEVKRDKVQFELARVRLPRGVGTLAERINSVEDKREKHSSNTLGRSIKRCRPASEFPITVGANCVRLRTHLHRTASASEYGLEPPL